MRNQCSRSARRIRPRISRGLVAIRVGPTLLMIGSLCCPSLRLFAQTPDLTSSGQPNKSWTAITDLKSDDLLPTRLPVRIVESHTQSGNQAQDKRSVEVRGTDGRLETYQEIEQETSQLDASTVRTVTRTFSPDLNGRKVLVQVTEEVKHVLPGDESTVARVSYNPDVNGRLQAVQRDIVETRNTGQGSQETNTTVMLPSAYGDLAPAFKTVEIRKQDTNGSLKTDKTTWLPDLNGKWQVKEIRQDNSNHEANDWTSEETVFRPDAEGRLEQTSRVVRHQSDSPDGEKRSSVETYSIDLAGMTRDGHLHLAERDTIVSDSGSTGGATTEEKVEEINPGDPHAGLRLSVVVDGVMVPGPSGEQSTVTIRTRDSNDSFGVVSVDTTASDRIPAFDIQQTPSEQPNYNPR